MLKRRVECDTYLTHICRHRWSRENPVKVWNIRSFQSTLKFSSAVDVDESTAYENHSIGWKVYIIFLQRILSAPVMSTYVSQVGVALYPSFLHFLSFHFSRFSFYVNSSIIFSSFSFHTQVQGCVFRFVVDKHNLNILLILCPYNLHYLIMSNFQKFLMLWHVVFIVNILTKKWRDVRMKVHGN